MALHINEKPKVQIPRNTSNIEPGGKINIKQKANTPSRINNHIRNVTNCFSIKKSNFTSLF